MSATQHLREQRIRIARSVRQNAVGKLFGAPQLGFERALHGWIRSLLFLDQKFFVLHKKLGLKDVEAIEFGEEIRRGVGNRSQRILRMELFPGGETLMRLGELQVIHVPITQIQAGSGERNFGAGEGHGDQQQADNLASHQISSTRRARPSASDQNAQPASYRI
jgi:hypothetical protein